MQTDFYEKMLASALFLSVMTLSINAVVPLQDKVMSYSKDVTLILLGALSSNITKEK